MTETTSMSVDTQEDSAEYIEATAALMDHQRAAFLAERATGIGGSDISAVFNISYGCRKRLWHEKRGDKADFPRSTSGPMELGNLMEPYFADWYARITGRPVAQVAAQRHADYPELLVHMDRMVTDPAKDGPGYLEIKSMGRGAYFTAKRKGLAEDYILQVQHGLAVTGWKWGSYAIGCRDFGVSGPADLLCWDVARDEEVCQQILTEGPIFWAQVQNGPIPEALEPDDARCQDCEYRTSCQGAALIQIEKGSDYEQDDSLRPLVMEYVERAALAKEAKALLDDTKEEIKARLGARSMVMAAGAKIQHYSFTKKAYTVAEHVETPLRIYPAKAGK